MSAILSVGIDIGTSTTQVIFSRINLDNTAGYFSAPRIAITGKKIIYKSRIYFTPLRTPVLLDGAGIRDIVETEYKAAGYRPKDVDTGAVIITGESARKENAAVVLEQLSGFAGDFVVSTAGPDLESIIAGKGSGAFQYSIDHECSVMNLDIGGGTTNIVRFHAGEIEGKICLDVGGRLIRLKKDWTVEYISPSALRIAENAGVIVREGHQIEIDELQKITNCMAELLAQAVGLQSGGNLLRQVRTSNSSPTTQLARADVICFSGGVADCMMTENVTDPLQYGDIGFLLGQSIRENRSFSTAKQIQAGETIRATVVGAGTHTTSLSGSTITYSSGIFPIKNLPVLKLTAKEEAACMTGDVNSLQTRVEWFINQNDTHRLMLAMCGPEDPDFEELKKLSGVILQVMEKNLPSDEPIIVSVERDIAKALGVAMRTISGGRRKIVSIDSVKVETGDFIDIGVPLMDGLVVPVVVKTLLFE